MISALMHEDVAYIPVSRWYDMEQLVKSPVLLFATRVNLKTGQYETNQDVMYTGVLTYDKRAADEIRYIISGAAQYRRTANGWEEDSTRYVVGVSSADFEARRVHYPAILQEKMA